MTRRLSKDEYLATLAHPMRDVRNSAESFVDVEPYLKEIPESEWNGHKLASRIPERVYLSPEGRYEHYLIPTTSTNVFMVVIADNLWRGFHGHLLVDFNELYGKKA